MNYYKQRGLTLVELMIAVVLGMVVTAAVTMLYINSSRGFREDDQYARMIENGRFAMHFLGEDLQMANFWGYSITPDRIEVAGFDDVACGTQPFHETSTEYGLHLLTGSDPLACDDFGTIPPGFSDSDESTASAVLLIKRTGGTPLKNPGPGTAETKVVDQGSYLVVSPSVAKVSNGTSVEVKDNEWLWSFDSAIYFVTTGDPPELCRMKLRDGVKPSRECLVRGVERMRVEFGIDNDGDNRPDEFVSDKSALPADMQKAYSARVCLLLRTEQKLHGATDNPNTYSLCGETFDPADDDGYMRRVVEKTFQLRNNASLAAFD